MSIRMWDYIADIPERIRKIGKTGVDWFSDISNVPLNDLVISSTHFWSSEQINNHVNSQINSVYSGGTPVFSNPGAITGSSPLTNIVIISEVEYKAIPTPNPETIYFVTNQLTASANVAAIYVLSQAVFDTITPLENVLYIIE
ncbi:MAG: hypothetical protein QNJ68_10320 [Microcoleaceae cyanobacterium MO_207.B10]|nr:hypothetical protein [Microcoleaceae cyanobacterium MO_207.B10]